MIKYIFTKSELKTLFYLTGHTDFKCELFDVAELKQDEFEAAEESLISKNLIYRVNNTDISVDKMFVALVNEIAAAEYICGKDHVIAAVGSITVVLEEDVRNTAIVKMIPYKGIEEVVEDYGTDLLI